MSASYKTGTCRLCGFEGELSFEHVPPESALNDRPALLRNFEDLLNAQTVEELEKPRGRIQQRGMAIDSCIKCNNNTGGWFGKAYVDWAFQGLVTSARAEKAPAIYQVFHIYPLRVLKQIVCMFFSANSPGFGDAQPDLLRFAMSKERKYFPPNVRIFAAYNVSKVARQSGVSGIGNLLERRFKLFSEICYPPFSYVLSIDSEPPNNKLVDISFLHGYSYNTWTQVSLNLPVLPIFCSISGRLPNQGTGCTGLYPKCKVGGCALR